MATTANISFNGETNELTVTFEGEPSVNQKQRIFIKPSSDYGTFSTHRKSSSYEDYLTVLREGSLTITRPSDSQALTFGLGQGDNYSNGFFVKVDENTSEPLTANNGESIVFQLSYIGAEALRIEFEVF